MRSVLDIIRRLAGSDSSTDSDRDLLDRYVANRDVAAFEQIVHRHGSMVWKVSRSLLADTQDADDVFQATFVVLLRKAGAVRWRDSVAGWLYEVAHRLARKARSQSARRQDKESRVAAMTPTHDDPIQTQESKQILHEELLQLPAKYRDAVVLCYLENRTNEDAAASLGCPVGTLKFRLSEARERLRQRLTRRGLALSAAGVTLLFESQAPAAVPDALLTPLMQAVSASGPLSPGVALLVEGAVRDMFLRKTRFAVAGVLALIALGVSSSLLFSKADHKPIVLVKSDQITDKDRAELTAGNRGFAMDLYRNVADREGNLLVSPYSISSALAMTMAGARGDTEAEMAKTLKLTLPQERLHPAFSLLQNDMKRDPAKSGYDLHIANRLFGRKGDKFHQDYLNLTKDQYGAEMVGVDFIGDADGAVRSINDWIATQTKDKIKDVVKPSGFTAHTALVLANAIYFESKWASEFKADKTKVVPFKTTDKESVQVATMKQNQVCPYAETDDVQVVALPYKAKNLSMVVVLPKKVDGLRKIEKDLTMKQVDGWIDSLKQESVDILLPKFSFSSEFEMSETLQGMGMNAPFSSKADFSGIAGSPGLYISAVRHKTFIEVSEEGTKAAAATAIEMLWLSDTPKADKTFNADHPFLFLIYDKSTKSVLFMGRVMNPKA